MAELPESHTLKALEKSSEAPAISEDKAIYIRLDGCGFSRFTKGLARPYDVRFRDLMAECTRSLMENWGAVWGYHQSDEISIVLAPPSEGGHHPYSGRPIKIATIMAAQLTLEFNSVADNYIADHMSESRYPALFDARVVGMSQDEVVDMLLWRENDARRNSISMLGQCHFSHKSLQGKSSRNIIDCLSEEGIEWSNMPLRFRYGEHIMRRQKQRCLTADELERIPEKHRPAPDHTYLRTVYEVLEQPLWSYEGSKGLVFQAL